MRQTEGKSAATGEHQPQQPGGLHSCYGVRHGGGKEEEPRRRDVNHRQRERKHASKRVRKKNDESKKEKTITTVRRVSKQASEQASKRVSKDRKGTGRRIRTGPKPTMSVRTYEQSKWNRHHSRTVGIYVVACISSNASDTCNCSNVAPARIRRLGFVVVGTAVIMSLAMLVIAIFIIVIVVIIIMIIIIIEITETQSTGGSYRHE